MLKKHTIIILNLNYVFNTEAFATIDIEVLIGSYATWSVVAP